MSHDVFISYSSKDKPIADAICANLEAAGVRCWIAPRDIAPGEDWPTAITRAISRSRVMVLVFSAFSNSSEDVSRELFLAANSKLVIIPFKIENIEPEPGKQYYLARTHWLDAINPPTQEQIQELVNRAKMLVPPREPAFIENQPDIGLSPGIAVQVDQAKEPVSTPSLLSTPKPVSNKGRISRWFWLLLVVMVVLLGLLGWGVSSQLLQNLASPFSKPVPNAPVAPAFPTSQCTYGGDPIYPPDANIIGTIMDPTCGDNYWFTLDKGIQLLLTVKTTSGNLQPHFTIQTDANDTCRNCANMTILANSVDTARQASLSITLPYTGDYYVSVTRAEQSSSGSYTLSITEPAK